MTTFSKHILVNAPSKQVWEVMANLGDIYKFNPNVSKSYYNTTQKQGIGAARICELRPAGKVEEVATQWDEGKGFTLKINPIEKAPPLKNFYASLSLVSAGAGGTQVTVTMKYETKLGVVGQVLNALMIKAQMQRAIEQLLEGLKLNVEQGIEVKDTHSLKTMLEAA